MSNCSFRLAVVAACFVFGYANQGSAVELYFNNVDADLPGTGIRPNGWWSWNEDGMVGSVFTEEVTETDGVGGTQSYRETTDSTAADGTSFFFVRGFGHFAVFADEENLLAGGVAGSNDPSRYRFSADVKVEGNNGAEAMTPLYIGVAAIDDDYETTHSIDVNNDTVIEGGASLYDVEINPTIATSGEYVNISFTLDQGVKAVDEDILPEHQMFSNTLSLQWYLSYNSGAFNLDADNVVNIDNVRIEFLDEVAIEGDHNGDGRVDAADYALWRDNPVDNGGNPAGYASFRDNFGAGAPGSGAALAVPEPTTFALAATLALAGLLVHARTRRTELE